jgi:hypothetical protein
VEHEVQPSNRLLPSCTFSDQFPIVMYAEDNYEAGDKGKGTHLTVHTDGGASSL